MKRLITALLSLAVILLPGCGVRPEQEPTAIEITAATPSSQPTPDDGPLTVTVYYIRNERLEPVERSVARASAATVLSLLTAGPTRREVTTGLRTALTLQPLTLTTDEKTPGTGDVTVTPDFTSISGQNQLLAVAQLVWTVTELPGIDRVRLSSNGKPLELPTDRGLSRIPVGRDDYMSVAPGSPPEPPESSTVATASAAGPG
ncbi:GerMN domain-containing protein [Georgenia sp. EYE_87]|uniref:GerMN domain-containing protein n=1 Tax=Georgenia sp. EYE_87 TaxID=2853448 RepID=UPI0020051A97|nr:GerMN domain-containing protein [Georgenia sp. EYE_87]MCK6210415.1 GerMN domain-containing protein [Georgenia sp. EYE_87]